MIQISSDWSAYYQELIPEKRKKLMDAAMEAHPEDPANPIRVKLFEHRFRTKKDDGKLADNFLWQCVNLVYLADVKMMRRVTREKQVRECIEGLGLNIPAETEEEKTAVYWELRNTIKRYFQSCQDRNYRKKLLGLVSLNDDERRFAICRDAFLMTRGITELTGLESELAPFAEAVRDEIALLDDEALEIYDSLHR